MSWMLNPTSPVPLYRQLADELVGEVRGGALGVGARLPSEHELARRFCVGRPTVRQATELLVRRGMIERRRGSGTFVRAPRQDVDLFTLSGTIAAFERTGIALTTRLVERVRLRSAEGVEAPLAGREVYTFARLGSVEHQPVLLEHFYLDPEVFPGLDALAVGHRRLSELVDEHYHRVPTGGRQTFHVAPAPEQWRAALEVGVHRPLLVVERWLDFAGAPNALFVRMHCRTDRVRFVQTLGPDGAPFAGESR